MMQSEQCNGCGACYNACPAKSIKMKVDEEGFFYPEVDYTSCLKCGLCKRICPEKKYRQQENEVRTAVAAINRNDAVRKESSSGGIFTLLAEAVIKSGGVVFGAAFSENFLSVRHIAIETIEKIDMLRGSKYLQSDIGDTYRQALEYLDSGRQVLFSGTPCQIAGLYSFCRKEYSNLLTCDFVCHGVASPLVWEKYIQLREKEEKSRAQRVQFRNKREGWKKYSFSIEFMNGAKYIQLARKDLYIRGFLADLYLRPSCYRCGFKGVDRYSDITLGDFWGIWNVAPQMDDNRGTSLIILHTQKGQNAFEEISGKIIQKPVDLDEAIRYNSAVIKSSACPIKKRERFFKALKKDDFSHVMKKYCGIKMKEKVRNVIKRMVRGIVKLVK